MWTMSVCWWGRHCSPEGARPAGVCVVGSGVWRLRVPSLPPPTPPNPHPLRGPAGSAACHTAVGFTSAKASEPITCVISNK